MTPVTRPGPLAGVALCASVLAGLLATVPAAAGPPTALDGAERRDRSDFGHTRGRDGVLQPGCHDYRYRYRLTIRTDDWSLETFLDDRRGDTMASGTFLADSEPKSGTARFRLCRYTTVAGRFTIRAKLHYYNDSGEHRVWLEPSSFRLRRR